MVRLVVKSNFSPFFLLQTKVDRYGLSRILKKISNVFNVSYYNQIQVDRALRSKNIQLNWRQRTRFKSNSFFSISSDWKRRYLQQHLKPDVLVITRAPVYNQNCWKRRRGGWRVFTEWLIEKVWNKLKVLFDIFLFTLPCNTGELPRNSENASVNLFDVAQFLNSHWKARTWKYIGLKTLFNKKARNFNKCFTTKIERKGKFV